MSSQQWVNTEIGLHKHSKTSLPHTHSQNMHRPAETESLLHTRKPNMHTHTQMQVITCIKTQTFND